VRGDIGVRVCVWMCVCEGITSRVRGGGGGGGGGEGKCIGGNASTRVSGRVEAARVIGMRRAPWSFAGMSHEHHSIESAAFLTQYDAPLSPSTTTLLDPPRPPPIPPPLQSNRRATRSTT
jgi:hypothetical protein